MPDADLTTVISATAATEADAVIAATPAAATAPDDAERERQEAEAAAAFAEDAGGTPAGDGTPAEPVRPAPRRRRQRRGTRSTIENHIDRARIERDLALGRPLARIAKKYGVSKDAAWRHKAKLPPQLKAALAAHALAPTEDLEKLRIDESEGLLASLGAQRARLLIAQDAALESEQFGIVAQLAGGIHRNIELVGKYLGEFASHATMTTISILITPEYLQMRTALVRALAPYREAAAAVAQVLHQIESAAAHRPALPAMKTIPMRAEAVDARPA